MVWRSYHLAATIDRKKKTHIMSKTATNRLARNYKKLANQQDAVLQTLLDGTEFSTAEAREAGISNPRAVVSKLRDEGFNIYSNRRGSVNRYRIANA